MRSFLIVGIVAGLLYAVLTPPFQVPDEVGHYWRATAIAEGQILPAATPEGTFAEIPEGARTLVFIFFRDIAYKPDTITYAQYRTGWELKPKDERVRVKIPGAYTAVAYAPQALAAVTGRLTGLHPFFTFYLGRLLNLLAFLGMTGAAVRVTPRLKSFFAAAALLPMPLFLAGSWSPDAMTIASSYLLLAMILRGVTSARDAWSAAAMGFIAGLCKPAYYLIALLALPVAWKKRAAAVAIVAATLAGAALSLGHAARAQEPAALHIDARQQLRGIAAEPVQFGRVAANEYTRYEYLEQMIGRLGMLEIPLPRWLIATVLVILLLAMITAGGEMSPALRVSALVILLGSLMGILLASYLTWTPIGGDTVEGIQGRYFLPLLPLVGVTFGFSVSRLAAIAPRLVVGGAAFWNAAALVVLALRFF